jgi:RND family efflux transporter MFP subunit
LRRSKKVIWIVVIAAAATFAGLRIREAYSLQTESAGKKGKKGGGSRIVSVSVEAAREGSVREEILLTGSLRSKEQVEVTAKATGRVEKIMFELGDKVKSGDLIAELEDDELQQQVNRANASIAVVRASTKQRMAELENSKAHLARAETLLKEGLIPKADYESRLTAFQVVEAQIQLAHAQERQAQAELNELKIRLAQTRIYSPMTGVVARRHVDPGALLGPSTPILSVVNLSTMVTMANVPEREVGKLRVGNKAMVEVDAFSDRKFTGRIARISPVLDAATRSATVEVEIPNPDGGLKVEMFARVTLDLESSRRAVLIPREGLVYRGQQPGVYVHQASRPVFRPVETGLIVGNDVEILANLEAGTAIVTRGASMLREGDQVQLAGEGKGRKGEARRAGAEKEGNVKAEATPNGAAGR